MQSPHTTQFNKHWGSWSRGYLKLAEQGFLYFKNQKKIGKESLFPKLKPLYSLEDGAMIIASIWNIKHALELVIKGLGVNLNKEYYYGHNLTLLLNDLDTKLKGFCIDRDLKLLKLITKKYYTCDFTSKTIFLDTENTLFKYPESSGFSLDYSFVHDLKKPDIIAFLKDISNLKRIYDIIEAQSNVFEQSKQIGLSTKEIEKRLMKVPTMKNPGYKK